MKLKNPFFNYFSLLATGLFSVTISSVEAASPSIWGGGSPTSNNWMDAGNWAGNVPVPGVAYDLQFAGTTRLISNNDFPDLSSFRNITFNAGSGAFVLGGNSITLNGNITNSSSNIQTINNAIVLAAGNHNLQTPNNTLYGLVLAGNISGTGGFTLQTNSLSAIYTLSGDNSYSGNTTVQFETLNINSNTALGVGGLIFTNNGRFDNTSGSAKTLANSINFTNAGTVTFTGTNELKFTGASTFTNNLTLSTTAGALTLDGGLTGAGNFTKSGAGTLNLSGTNNTSAGTITISAGSLQLSGGALASTTTLTLSGATSKLILGGNAGAVNQTLASLATTNTSASIVGGNAAVSVLTLNNSTANTITGRIGGVGINENNIGLTKEGTGRLTLSGTNTYNGTTTVNGGSLVLSGSLMSNIVVNSGGSVSGAGSTTGSIVINAGGNITAEAAGNFLKGVGLTVGGAGTYSIFGSIITGSTYTLYDYGAGGTITGSLSNLSGTVRATLNNDAANHLLTATILGVGTRTWNTTDGVWAINGPTNFLEGDQKFFDGDTAIFNERAANSVVTLTGVLTPAAVTVGNTSNSYTFAGTGSIAGSTASLTKSGAGALYINTSNTYGGGTTLNAGTLGLNNASAIGTGALTINGGTLDNTSGAAVTLSTNNAQTWAGDFAYTGTNNLNLGTGAVSLTSNRSVSTTAGTLTVGGVISGASFSLTKEGAGAMTLAAVNTYTGGTVVNGGALNLSAGGSAGAVRGVLTINSGAVVNLTAGDALGYGAGVKVDTVNINGGTLNNALNGNNGFSTNFVLTAGTMAETVVTTGANGYNFDSASTISSKAAATSSVVSGRVVIRSGSLGFNVEDGGATDDLLVSGAIQGSPGITKTGAGTMTISSNNTYTGATNVNEGRLLVNGSIATSTLTTVNAGATLGGSGTVGVLTVAAGGHVAPGNSPGILTTGNFTLQSGGNLDMEINSVAAGTGYDQLKVNGTTTLVGLLNLTVTGTYSTNDVVYLLVNDGADAIAGTFSNHVEGEVFTAGGQAWMITYFANSEGTPSFTGGNDVALMAVPEPSAALLTGLGALALLRRRR